ncbi:tripartite tricarboxylate transporter substrate binding protein [Saccharibacillus sp. CPCC 101409]|uniref:tripartite tricarboxylate transporter substrate binding protein n=1 Tax=Saccharibacillus sp. CPCC 101409 TaxID=3058041 RepID=UPI0026717044|nr:tripartite tricarboxylate transporter substrate binding protein [Saccharibacillus sp. CPCC 101409]MDO3411646.1 tripartite tricarboxylate transporter substrate binding protein [Saccharibacillus sp. CPCC 101409]
MNRFTGKRTGYAAAAAVLALALIAGLWTAFRPGEPDKRAAEGFPQKPITLIVPYSAGGGTDTMARALARSAERELGQPVTVVNRTGGGGAVGLMEGAEARPDGYTVTFMVSELTILPHLGLLPITYRDFKPIAQTSFDPSAITVRADAKWQTAAEFLADAKSHPGEIKMGNAGTGSIWHLAAVTLERGTGAQFRHIPYEGAGPAVSALLSGFVDAVPVSPAEVKTYVEEGQLRTLVVNADERSKALPDVPTLEEATGMRTDFAGTFRGLAVPSGTPDPVAAVLEHAFIEAAQSGGFRSEMEASGLGLRVRSGKEFEKQLQESHDRFAEMIPELGLSRN